MTEANPKSRTEEMEDAIEAEPIPVRIIKDVAEFNVDVNDFIMWPPLLNASGTTVLQFTDKWNYDIRRITAASFTAGTVNVYKGVADDAHILAVFTSAGSLYFSKGQLGVFRPGDNLIFVAAGIVGLVTITVAGFRFHKEVFGAYMM